MEKIRPRTIVDGFAFIISAIFSPYIAALVFIIIVTYNSADNLRQFLPWMITFILFALILPGIFVLWQMEIGKIKDLHISDAKERKIPFIVAAVSAIVGTLILIIMKAAHQVIVVAVAYSLNAIITAIITFYWKISIHMALFSSVATIAVILYGPKYFWLFLILIPLGWSRVHRKHHTLAQVIAGALLTFVLTTLVFWAFGYI